MSLNYASLLHTCFRHRLSSPTVARLDRRLDDDLITSARRADVSLLARPTHACTCYYRFPGNQGRGQPVWSWAAATNVQNSALFVTTFDFDRKYLQNGSAYRKSEKYLVNYISSPIGQKKIGELRSTNQKVIGTHVDPPNWTFFGKLYFGP